MYPKWLVHTTLAVAIATAGMANVVAQDDDDLSDVQERAIKAAEALRAMARAEDAHIPAELLAQAEGLAVIPGVVRGAFLVGGRKGKGLVTTRNAAREWGAPSYVSLGGASFGLQIGADSTDLVMVFTRKDGIEALLEDNLEFGADASVAAGPVGRSAEVGTNVTFDSPIYAYSRSKGAFAGVALNGAVMEVDDSANREAYGREITGRQILTGQQVKVPATAKPFMDAVREVTRSAKGD
jgi:lipid-binding SYLF domain-containing protein